MRILEPDKASEQNAGHVEQIFLENLERKQQAVQIYLMGGIKMVGTIKSFDDFTILISARSFGTQMIYKHAITTICAAHHEGK